MEIIDKNTLMVKLKKFFSKHNLIQFIQYGIVGALGTLLNLFILFILTDILSIYYLMSEAIAFIIASIHNYILDKISTFKEEIKKQPIVKYSKFLFVNIIGLIINLFILYILVDYFHIWYIFAEVFAIGCSFIFNYLGNKFWTFKPESKT